MSEANAFPAATLPTRATDARTFITKTGVAQGSINVADDTGVTSGKDQLSDPH
jgi:hypothetical protein